MDGKSEKLFAAILITAMLMGSALLLLGLFKAHKPTDAEKPADTAA